MVLIKEKKDNIFKKMKSNQKCTKRLKKKKFIEFKLSNYNKLPSDDLN